MEKKYEISHHSSEHVPFPISPKELEDEYDAFGTSVAHHGSNAKIISSVTISDEIITLTLKGSVIESELDAEAEQMLLKINNGSSNRVSKPCFVVNNQWVSKL